MRVCDATIEVLKETNNPAIMYGDEGLFHLVADKLGWPHEATRTSDRVLAALHKTPGPLIKTPTLGIGNRRMIRFVLPENT